MCTQFPIIHFFVSVFLHTLFFFLPQLPSIQPPHPLSVKQGQGLMGSEGLEIALLAWQGEEKSEHKKNINSFAVSYASFPCCHQTALPPVTFHHPLSKLQIHLINHYQSDLSVYKTEKWFNAVFGWKKPSSWFLTISCSHWGISECWRLCEYDTVSSLCSAFI